MGDVTHCEACGADMAEGGCTNPWCDRWRLAEEFDAVFPPPDDDK